MSEIEEEMSRQLEKSSKRVKNSRNELAQIKNIEEENSLKPTVKRSILEDIEQTLENSSNLKGMVEPK